MAQGHRSSWPSSTKTRTTTRCSRRARRSVSLYPDYVYDANAYEFIAEADLAKDDKKAAAAILTEYEKMGGRDPGTLKELASLEEELGEPKEAAATLDRINYIYPVNEDLHRHLGDLWFAQNNYTARSANTAAVVAMHPLDKASAQFNLAQAYFAERPDGQGGGRTCWRRSKPLPISAPLRNYSCSSKTPRKGNNRWLPC